MKVQVRQGRIRAIRKTLPADRVDGENVGIARFDAQAVGPLLEEVARLVSNGGLRQWLPAAFDAFVARHELYAIPTRGYPWTEIDSPDDYRHARDVVLPAIDGAMHASRAPAPGAAAEGSVQHV
jgi:choline kinase